MKQTLRLTGTILCITVVTLSLAAGVNTATITWTPPTAYSDGSVLPASDIDHYTVTWAPVSPQVGPSGSMNSPAPSNTAVIPVPCGSTSFTVSVTTTTSAKYPNATSGPSSAVPYISTISCTPNPPSGLAVH